MKKAIAFGRKCGAQMVVTLVSFCALLFTVALGSSPAQSRSMSQFQHTAWTLQSGAPAQIVALAQTRDGYIWLGTVNGLFRFDGVTFEAYVLPHGQHFPHTSIQSLTSTSDGGLWIGYSLGDTSLLKDGILQTHYFRKSVHLGGGTVYAIIPRRNGTLWAATEDGLIRFDAGKWHDAEDDPARRAKTVTNLFEDKTGSLWMATQDFVYRSEPNGSHLEKTSVSGGEDVVFTRSPDGSVWIADKRGIYEVTDSSGKWMPSRQVIQYRDGVNDLKFDDTGALWVAGSHAGVTRITRPRETLERSAASQQSDLEHMSLNNGLSGQMALALLKDREGNLWVATSDGLDRFRPSALAPAPVPATFDFFAPAAQPDGSLLIGTKADGLQMLAAGKLRKVNTGQQKTFTCVYHATDGKIWLGGHAELGYWQDGRYKPVALPKELQLPLRDTQAMTSGPNGDLWLQVQSRLGIFRLHGDEWIRVSNPTAEHDSVAVVLSADKVGRVWAGYMHGAIVIFDGDKRTQLTREQGLTVGNVLALSPSAEGMWIGGEHGLDLMTSSRPMELKFSGDTKIEGISGITRSDDGSLWLNSVPGILRITAAEVEQAVKNPSHAMHYRLFNYLDGLTGKAPQIRPLPSVVTGTQSTLWFTTTNGIVSIDAAHIYTNTLAPPVAINKLLVDGQPLDIADSVALPKGAKNLQIDYTALSLSIPERVRFRYKLEGYDKQWQDVGTRRQAFYTHLPPGHYTFRVTACNDDGVWNEIGASAIFFLPPTFLQSWYFKVLVAILFFGATWLFYLFRMKRQTSRMQARIQERFSERERIARELHDTLFQSVEGSLLHLNAVTSRLTVEPEVKDQLRNAYGEVDRVMGQARSLVFDLRQPVDSQDLGSMIKLFAEEIGGLSDVAVEVQIRGSYMELKPAAYDQVMKIIKECIWNSFRHARPSLIQVNIHYGSKFFEVLVFDDGIGIDPAILEQGSREGHWGLPGMRERAAKMRGKLIIRRRERGGTEIHLKIRAAEISSMSGDTHLFSLRHMWSNTRSN